MLADRVGQPFNVPLIKELKVILNYKRADYFQQILDKHPEQRKYFLKDFTVELEETDKAECITSGCTIRKSILKVPLPVRTKDTLFDYVGDADKQSSYRYMTPDQSLLSSSTARYTATRPSYYYANGYIYIYNDDDIEYINVRGVFSDPSQLSSFKCGTTPCYTDNDSFEMPEDIVNTMVQDVLKNELRNLMHELGEVEVTTQPKDNVS